MNPIVFHIAAFVTVFATVLMILQENPVTSAVLLVASFFSLAVIYVGLDAHFVAALQILVYAGAIMVLFIFVIMLLNLREDELVRDKPNAKRLIVALIGAGLFAFLARFIFKIPSVEFAALPERFGTVHEVAKVMLTDYVVPFELLGLLLLVGLVGAIVLGKKEE
jgi:NADH-quinone oxidoreductase subunit J